MNSCIIRYLVCAVCAAILIVQWGCSPEKSGEHRREAQTLAANVHQRVCTAKEKIDRGRHNDAFVLLKDAEKLMADAGPEISGAVAGQDLYLLNVYKANLYTSYRDFPRAAKAYSDAIRYASSAEDSLNRMLDISVISSHSGDSVNARRALDRMKAIPAVRTTQKEYSVAIGEAYMEKFFGDRRKSAALFRRSLELASKPDMNPHRKLTPVSELYEYYTSAGNMDSMTYYLGDYQRLANEFRIPDMMADVKEGFLRAYIIKGDREKALRAFDEYFSIVDSLYNASGFIALNSKYNDDEIERSNDRIVNLQIAVSRQKAILYAIAFLLVVAAVVWLLWRYARLSQKRIFFLNREIARQDTASMLQPDEPEPEKPQDDAAELTSGGTQSNGDLFRRIERIMENPAIYCDPDFSIQTLAGLVDSNTKYVSQAINSIAGMNFRTYINTLRVKVARTRLAGSAEYSNQTIQSVAESVGFRSPSNFVIAFKRVMGITPSAYQKLVRQNSEK